MQALFLVVFFTVVLAPVFVASVVKDGSPFRSRYWRS